MPDSERAQRRGRPPLVSREAIIGSALQEGLADFTMTAVAKRLNITHGALYRYFPSREDLALAAVDAVVGAEVCRCAAGSWRELLTAFAHSLWSLCRRTSGLAECLLNPAWTSLEFVRVIDEHVAVLSGLGVDDAAASSAVELISDAVVLASTRRSGGQPVGLDELDRKVQLVLDGVAARLTASP